MKCRKCGGKASVNMRQHKLALCKEHYLEWIPEQTERFIKKYGMFKRDDKILVAVSGGKDSLALWDILNRLGYQADGLYLGLGIDEEVGYSHESQRLTEKFANENNLKLHIVDIEKEYGQPIPVLSEVSRRGHGKPCAVCGLAKRHEMNRIARDLGYAVLATGHNLDDEVQSFLMNVFRNDTGRAYRGGPMSGVVRSKQFVPRIKPLYMHSENEITTFSKLKGFKVKYTRCPCASGSFRMEFRTMLEPYVKKHPDALYNINTTATKKWL